MKLPWSSLNKEKKNQGKITTEEQKQIIPTKKDAILTFDGKRYDFNSLPDNIKILAIGMQKAEAQIQIQQDTIRFIALGRKYMAEELSKKLKSIRTIPSVNKN